MKILNLMLSYCPTPTVHSFLCPSGSLWNPKSFFFPSGTTALKLIYHHRNDKVSGESLNNYIYTRASFFNISSMVQFLERVVAEKNGSFADPKSHFENTVKKSLSCNFIVMQV